MSGFKTYRVAPGHTMRADDGTNKTGGQEIDVADDLAADHIRAGRLEPTPVDKPAAPGADNAGDAAAIEQ